MPLLKGIKIFRNSIKSLKMKLGKFMKLDRCFSAKNALYLILCALA